MSSRVKDVMTKDVVSVRVTAKYKVIIAVMRELHISAFPVLDSADHLVGVVSEADLLLKQIGPDVLAGHLISSGEGEGAKASGVTAGQLMTKPPFTIGPDDSLADAARLMHDRRVKRLPVVDNAGELVGIVSRVDVLSVFDRPDAEIRDAVTEKVIVGDFALDPSALDVTVRFRHRYNRWAGREPRCRNPPDRHAPACGGRCRCAGQARLSPGRSG